MVPGWFLIDNFTDWDPGLLRDSTKVGRKEYWTDPSPNPAGFLTDLEGNQVLTLNQEGPETIFTSLQSMETEDSDTRTVYFRLRFNEADDRAAYFHVGLTNKSMRGDGFEGDTANDLGGFAVISRQESDDFGTISVGPGNDPLDFELAVGTWYRCGWTSPTARETAMTPSPFTSPKRTGRGRLSSRMPKEIAGT